jgi:hypothetical protein
MRLIKDGNCKFFAAPSINIPHPNFHQSHPGSDFKQIAKT